MHKAHLEIILSLLRRESTAVADQVDKAHSNTTIDVEDQRVLLAGGDGLNGEGVVKELVAWEVLEDKLLHELNTKIWVVA